MGQHLRKIRNLTRLSQCTETVTEHSSMLMYYWHHDNAAYTIHSDTTQRRRGRH